MSFVLLVVALVVVFALMLYSAIKMSLPKKKVRHPTVWEQYLEAERRKQAERDKGT